MIKYVRLNNYKSLVNLKVDFMKTQTRPKDLILIYGENGVGKSNFATAFFTLGETIRTKSSIERWKEILENINNEEKNSKEYFEFLEEQIKPRYKDISMIINSCKTIDSKENMILEFGFNIKGQNGTYYIEMNDEEIVSERLDYVLNKNQTCYFYLDKESSKPKPKVNENIFKDKKYYNDFLELIEQYWGKHSFLSLLSYEIEDKKKDYVKKRVSTSLYQVLFYLASICTKVKGGNHSEYGSIGVNYPMLHRLKEGKIDIKKTEELNKAEEFLNLFFTELYSDIKNVYYKKETLETKIKYKLYFKKMIYNKLLDIDFDLESSGTQNLLDLLPYLISACEGQTVVIDEMDTGIHDLLINNIIINLAKKIKGQIIITTHNTLLLESKIDKSDIYVFDVNKNNEKELIAITDFAGRIHKNLNPRKKYLNGMYGGIPFISDIDFYDLLEKLK